MNHLFLTATAAAALLSLTACDPAGRRTPERTKAPGPTPAPSVKRPPTEPVERGPRDTVEQTPVEKKTDVIPPPPSGPSIQPAQYGIKVEGKAGYIRSPYSGDQRLIDVRGLPPATEIEDPYTPGRTILVP